MRFLNFIRSLTDVFTRDSVMESCAVTQSSIREHTLPAYSSAAALYKGKKFKSKDIEPYMTYYTRTTGNRNYLESVVVALANADAILDALGVRSKKVMAENEAKMGLTYVKSSLVRLVQCAEYANTYARRFLNYIYICETVVEDLDDHAQLSDAEIKWLKDGLADFCICIKILEMPVKTVEKHLDSMPDAVVTDLTEKTFITTIGEGKLDPFQMRHLSASVNPFYILGMIQADFQAKKYKGAKEEAELLQLRLLNLKKQMEKTPDAKLEKEIAYFQNRISDMHFAIAKMESNYGLD